MSAEFLSEFSELENKIEALLRSFETVKEQNAVLGQSSAELEGENRELKTQVESLEAELNEQREKMSNASERVKGLLAKFDAAL